MSEVKYTSNNPPSITGIMRRGEKDFHRDFPDACAQYERDQNMIDIHPHDGDRLQYLSQRLAQTSISVREMYKQLYHARVQSSAQSILIITKARDNHLVLLTRELSIWLMNYKKQGSKRGLVVYVDEQLRHSKRFDVVGIERDYPHFFLPTRDDTPIPKHQCLDSDEGQLRFWKSDMCSSSPALFDLVITLGGDGTVLLASWLFQSSVPPVIPFSLGSLGFLTPFRFEDYESIMRSALSNGVRLSVRMRFRATVYRAIDHVNPELGAKRRRALQSDNAETMLHNIKTCGWYCVEMEPGSDGMEEAPVFHDQQVHTFRTRPVESFEFLNDLVVDRGPSPYVTMLEVFADDTHLTTAYADGLCISTPTGSTAYSLSAGGSLVHPQIPAMLITPICPHTLSFRPMLVPDSLELRIAVPHNSRSNAWASFDGRGRVEIARGDHIKITASPYPFLSVLPEDKNESWFDSVSRTLNWNQRKHQMGFMVYDGQASSSKAPQELSPKVTPSMLAQQDQVTYDVLRDSRELNEHVAEDDEEDDEEIFDIDDTATPSTADSSHRASWESSSFGVSRPLLSVPVSESQPDLSPQAPLPIPSRDQPRSSGFGWIRSPDRYGPSGPPPAPAPLNERYLATVDFRLQNRSLKGPGP